MEMNVSIAFETQNSKSISSSQLPSFASHSNIHFPSPYFLHIPTFYDASSLPLPEGRAGTA